MACSIKQPKNTFSASFLKSYNQKGIFSKDYTVFFPLLLLHINILPHFPCPLLLFSRRESNHQPMEHWASFTATPGNSTVPQHSDWAGLGQSQGTRDFHTELWHLPHSRESTKPCSPSSCRRVPSPAVQRLQKDLHSAMLAALSASIPGKLCINAH